MRKIAFYLALSLLVNMGIYSQKSPENFGKNIDKQLRNEVCPIDSSAGAYVIFDHCFVDFDYSHGFFWEMYRHIRIKILDKSELDQASFSIPIYKNPSGEEKVLNLKAVSYNLKDGKIINSKIGQKEGITEERSEHWNLFKFALKNVEEGSIIEISYKLKSPFAMYLRDWNFQWDIPVLHSEAYIRIPEYFEYNQNLRGYFSLTVSEEFQENGSIMITQKGEIPNNIGPNQIRSAPSSQKIEYMVNTKHYVANNLPALEEEEFVDNMENYRSSIEFELSYSKINTTVTSYTTSWDAVTETLMGANYFGLKLGKVGFAKNDVENLIANHTDKRDLMEAIYTFVQGKVKWNGLTGLTYDGPLREVYISESGRAADINFILINMLREAGFNAFPVALSTRQNGVTLPAFPTLDGFNYMIALVILDDENILLDASSSFCPPGVLPIRCLNGRGRIIDKKYNSWIDLEPKGKFKEMTMYDLSIDEMGGFSGNVVTSSNEYASIRYREQVEEALSIDKMMEDLEESNPGMDVISHEITGLDSPFGPTRSILEIKIGAQSEYMGDMIIFNPLLYEKISSNPFKLENREHPVNYTYLRDYKYIFKYIIPDGFEVESLPDPLVIANTDKSARFVYSASQIGNIVNLTVMLNINKVVFIQSEYKDLKEFYNQLVAKEAEQIILKKISNL